MLTLRNFNRARLKVIMSDEPKHDEPAETSPPFSCGIIMPISTVDGLSAEHWSDVKSIIQEAVDSIAAPKFVARLVSEADDVGVIHKRIVQGVYSSDIVICDVSGKNANVMFELGMRLAFDKPTIIIKDDKTDYSFDTSVIEHIPYPRDLRFAKINSFKKQLSEKIIATHKAARSNPDHSTFLKNFGTFKVAHLNQKEATGEVVMIDMLADLQQAVSELRRAQRTKPRTLNSVSSGVKQIVGALLEIMVKEPELPLEPSDELIGRLIENSALTREFRTQESFIEGVALACETLRRP